ncbi:hypothetical protein [Litorihabitans aurantiacus]|uniref:hypothetical protein n=1 Tax=Litorihabitans aurantiacus TaxID=1930061 RepID=UPI0024E0ED2A|nr:hypothetical protein [Litorihabitans aurantiacus]
MVAAPGGVPASVAGHPEADGEEVGAVVDDVGDGALEELLEDGSVLGAGELAVVEEVSDGAGDGASPPGLQPATRSTAAVRPTRVRGR